ncbi:solute carrier family 46 member 3-like isoform X2 [Leptidea sinapis]|uniref:solute carrier family 46 member 3-like isoform X2 n=1 Tax=Leptidea sinapis TaxID=189913 RepID=UPI0021C4B334|nr:solute carrier family 46 member 3-like isoform X2 [Leptidea sinapis]
MSIDTREKESKTADSKLNNKPRNDLIVPSDIRNSMSKSKMDNKYLSTKPDDPPDDCSRLNFFQRARKMMALITVEPILACFVMPSVLSSLATQNLYLEKACRVNLQFDHHICDALTKRQTANYTFEEEAVQTLVASVAGWKTVLQSFLPCGILIFLGAYSDRVGQRKFCMLLPIIGEFLTSIGMIVNTYFFYELPVEVAAVTEAIFPALSGGWFTMFMGVFSYIADVTTEEQRTLRIGIVNLFYSLGVPVGAALSGILVRKIGLYGVFSISATLYVLSFLYGYFRIKEVRRTDLNKPAKNCCVWLKDFFDMRYVKDTMMVAFKTGPNNRRLRVIMLVVVLCVVIGPIYGEMSVMYLFTRYRFNWNEVDFSMFSTYAMCTSLVGTLFSVGVFSHVLKFDDAVIGIISSTSKILSGFMYAFATKTWHMYLAPLIEIFNGTSFIAMRSMVSKLVEKDELGKVNSFFGLAEAMMPLVYAPMYTTVYTATLKTFPGAFFLLGGGMTIPAVLIFLWLYLASKKHIASEKDLHDKQNEAAKDEKCEKLGHENMAFENDDKQYLKNNSASENPVLNFEHAASPSEIEIGITKSMQCTSKL